MEERPKISIIVATYNEAKNPIFSQIIANLAPLLGDDRFEVLFVDGASTDTTKEQIQNAGFRVITTKLSSRARRFNEAVALARGQLILLHHPRSTLSTKAYWSLLEFSQTGGWGAFRHRFDMQHPILRFTSFYSNFVRLRIFAIAYLDHCIFVDRQLLVNVGGIPELDVFEDTALSKNLRQFGRPVLWRYFATTSAVRFRKNGILKQVILNQLMKVGYLLGFDHKWLNNIYERSTQLNPRGKF